MSAVGRDQIPDFPDDYAPGISVHHLTAAELNEHDRQVAEKERARLRAFLDGLVEHFERGGLVRFGRSNALAALRYLDEFEEQASSNTRNKGADHD